MVIKGAIYNNRNNLPFIQFSMISVLVCSIRPDFVKKLQVNVKETIGVPYEMLVYDNRVQNKGICAVYNELAEKAAHDVLCFIHEDILFSTQDWGKVLLEQLTSVADVIGVAGSKYKSSLFSGWYTGQPQFDCAKYQHLHKGKIEKVVLQPHKNHDIEEVVCLDGVFICCTKGVWKDVKFADADLKGFHFYDIDFSLRASKKYRVAVTFLIDFLHLTEGGDFGNRWVETAFLYHDKRREELPFTKEFSPSKTADRKIAKAYLDFLKNHKISFRNKLRWVREQKLYQQADLYYSISKFLLYKPLGLKHVHNLIKSK